MRIDAALVRGLLFGICTKFTLGAGQDVDPQQFVEERLGVHKTIDNEHIQKTPEITLYSSPEIKGIISKTARSNKHSPGAATRTAGGQNKNRRQREPTPLLSRNLLRPTPDGSEEMSSSQSASSTHMETLVLKFIDVVFDSETHLSLQFEQFMQHVLIDALNTTQITIMSIREGSLIVEGSILSSALARMQEATILKEIEARAKIGRVLIEGPASESDRIPVEGDQTAKKVVGGVLVTALGVFLASIVWVATSSHRNKRRDSLDYGRVMRSSTPSHAGTKSEVGVDSRVDFRLFSRRTPATLQQAAQALVTQTDRAGISLKQPAKLGINTVNITTGKIVSKFMSGIWNVPENELLKVCSSLASLANTVSLIPDNFVNHMNDNEDEALRLIVVNRVVHERILRELQATSRVLAGVNHGTYLPDIATSIDKLNESFAQSIADVGRHCRKLPPSLLELPPNFRMYSGFEIDRLMRKAHNFLCLALLRERPLGPCQIEFSDISWADSHNINVAHQQALANVSPLYKTVERTVSAPAIYNGKEVTMCKMTSGELHWEERSAPSVGLVVAEVSRWMSMEHRCIWECFGGCLDQKGHLWLVMKNRMIDLAQYMHLKSRPLLLHEFIDVMTDVTDALEMLHRRGVFYGNINPKAIHVEMGDDNKTHAKLAPVSTVSAQPFVYPQEVNGASGWAQDIYFLGLLMFECIEGFGAYERRNVDKPWSVCDTYPSELLQLILDCLQVDAKLRPSALEINTQLLPQVHTQPPNSKEDVLVLT